MSGNSLRLLVMLAGLPLLVLIGGCAIGADLVNPSFLSALGLDPATIVPSQGRTLVSFTNGTQYEATFSVVVTPDLLASANEATLGDADVAAGETRTLPFDCPAAGVIVPGDLSAELAIGTTAVTVVVDGAEVALTYEGSQLQAGRDYVCGDVIEIRLLQVGEGIGADDFAIQVRVLPGR